VPPGPAAAGSAPPDSRPAGRSADAGSAPPSSPAAAQAAGWLTAAAQPADPLDALLAGLSRADKVGQLLLVGFEGGDPAAARPAIEALRVGGIALLANASTASQARALTAGLQQQAGQAGVLPLLIGVDHEGGAVQRIVTGVTSFGPNLDLGGLEPAAALEAACGRGARQGRELAGLGIQLNFAPVLDVWDNPQNTVIGDRAYSDDPAVVARLGAGYIEALQAAGVLAVGKHFPGHGSSTEDSHLTLPVVRHDRAWLERHELVPFRAALEAGVGALMTAHVHYPLLDSTPDRPASLSPVLVNGLLRGELEYDGLVLTDDLGAMRAVTDRFDPGEAAVRAIEAGSDLLVSVGALEQQRQMRDALLGAVGTRLSEARLDDSVRRVLRAKRQVGLLGPPPALPAPATPRCPGAGAGG
jgi:beta-N-acetylhexosaminidase